MRHVRCGVIAVGVARWSVMSKLSAVKTLRQHLVELRDQVAEVAR
jgi:hypothetical protein